MQEFIYVDPIHGWHYHYEGCSLAFPPGYAKVPSIVLSNLRTSWNRKYQPCPKCVLGGQ